MAMTAVAVAGWILTTGAAGQPQHDRPAAKAGIAPLVFGIYPGGAAGVLGPSGQVKPDDPAKRLAALRRLRPAGRPFVVRLYAAYYGPGGEPAGAQLAPQLHDYTSAGLNIELVLTYRPQGRGPDVGGFVGFVRNTVRALGSNRRLVSLQVTNETNVGEAPNVADGYYAGAKDALIRGVIAAKQEARGDGFKQIKVGFNWAALTGAGDRAFWTYLGRHGGRSFVAALDWVGIDAYPGTWGTPLRSRSLQAGTTAFLIRALSMLDSTLMPLARIPRTIPLHVSESGYPTGPGRTANMQVTSLRSGIAAIEAARRTYNVTSYSWFDLRDSDSSSSSFQSQYGLLRDDYSPKPAFAVYRILVAKLTRR